MTAEAGFEAALRERLGPDRVTPHAPLAPLTTFKVGGAADWLIDVRSEGDLRAVIAAASQFGIPITVLGGGSNVLISDRGIRGAVVRLRLTGVAQPSADRVRAEAGVTINGLVRWMIARGLGGLEAWAGTPGTVGGAICGNAHYAGRNIGDCVAAVMLASTSGSMAVVPARDMEFAYDASRVQRTHEMVIWAEFHARPAAAEQLRQVARASLAHRKRTQPLDTPSAGCIFQNPDPGREVLPPGIPPSAGALVDRAGLKGYRIGGARISPTHANFVLNDGHATAAEIRTLVEAARRAVRDKYAVELRNEIVLLGDFVDG